MLVTASQTIDYNYHIQRYQTFDYYYNGHRHQTIDYNYSRLIATGEWGVCLLSSCKVRYPQNKSLKVKMLSLDIEYMMFFGVTVQEID